MMRMLWHEFVDLRSDTPLPADTTELQKLAVIAVLLLRPVIAFLLLSPIGWNLMGLIR